MATISAKEQAIILESLKTEGLTTLISIQQNVDYAPLLKDVAFMKKAVKLNRDAIRYADLNLVRELVKTDGMLLENASIEAKADEAAVFNAVSNVGKAIQFADKQFLSNEEIAYEAVKKDWRMLGVVNKKFRGRFDFAMVSLNQDPAARDLLSPELAKNNKTIALLVADKMQLPLSDFSRGMRKDVDIVLKMTEKEPKNVRFALGDAKNSKLIALRAVAKDSSVYKYLPRALQQDEDIAIIMVTKNMNIIKKLGPVAYSRKVALAAVQQNGLALEKYKNSSIARNRNIVEAALFQDGDSFQYAHKSLRKDKGLLLLALKHICKTTTLKDNPLNFAPKKYCKDVSVLMESVKHEPLSLAFAKGKARSSISLTLEAVKGNGLAIQYAPKKEQNNPQIVFEALSNHEKAVKYISKKFLESEKNKSGLIAVLKEQPYLYDKFSQSIKNDPEAILFVASIYPEAAKNLPREYKQNKEYMKQLAIRSPEAFEMGISIKLSLDDKFMKEAKFIMENKEAREKQNKETKMYSYVRDENGNILKTIHTVTEEEKPGKVEKIEKTETAQKIKTPEDKTEEDKQEVKKEIKANSKSLMLVPEVKTPEKDEGISLEIK